MTEEEAATTPQDVQYQHEVATERRALRYWLIKTVVVTIAVCVVVVVGEAAYSTLIEGKKFEGTMLQQFIKGIGEIIDALE